jgi:hypothetical protein
MSVAKSYEKYPLHGDPYEQNKRMYIKIEYPCCRKASCSKCGGQGYYLKEVRWYEEPMVFNARQGFGFYEAGFITIFRGSTEEIDTYVRDNLIGRARYNTIFGWHLPSSYEVPTNLPPTIEPKKLMWEQVSTNNKINDYDDIRKLVLSITSLEASGYDSEYVGNVNDKIEKDLVVIKLTAAQGYYGDSNIHIFEDEDGNRYMWKTAARKLEVGEIYRLKGTIKEHTKIEGIKHTVLTRCKEG